MSNVLVVGGAGYIGGCLTDVLVGQGHNVTVFDRLLYEERFLKEVPFVFGDVRDTGALASIHHKYDKIIWLAAIGATGLISDPPRVGPAEGSPRTDGSSRFLNFAFITASCCRSCRAVDSSRDEKLFR